MYDFLLVIRNSHVSVLYVSEILSFAYELRACIGANLKRTLILDTKVTIFYSSVIVLQLIYAILSVTLDLENNVSSNSYGAIR